MIGEFNFKNYTKTRFYNNEDFLIKIFLNFCKFRTQSFLDLIKKILKLAFIYNLYRE